MFVGPLVAFLYPNSTPWRVWVYVCAILGTYYIKCIKIIGINFIVYVDMQGFPHTFCIELFYHRFIKIHEDHGSVLTRYFQLHVRNHGRMYFDLHALGGNPSKGAGRTDSHRRCWQTSLKGHLQ